MNETQFTFGQLAINTAAGCASTLLMLRTIAVWNRAHFVTAPLITASLGLWGLLLYDVATFQGSWNDVFGVCQTGNGISGPTGAIIFMYGASSVLLSSDMPNINVKYSDVV